MRLRFALILAVAMCCGIVSAGDQRRPPNIVHIIADDLGYDDVGCFGAKDIATPHIDKLAVQGMRFTNFYAPSCTCTPTRAALLTGCHAQRVGLPQVLFPNSTTGLNESEITIAELLQQRGYATALIGKWHLGYQEKFLPPQHGFDLFFGIPYPNDHVPERLEGNTGKSRGFPPMPLFRGTAIVEQPAQLASLPERFTNEAVKFISDNKDKPLYLHLGNIETHTPWLVPQAFQYKTAAGVYGDAVACLDWTVGQVMDTLQKLNLDNDTLVVFTSDNGPLVHRYPELEGIYGHAATVRTDRKHLLREGKYQARYEGGPRVSCIMRWPGKIPANATCHEIAAGFDLYTTFAKIAGAELPAGRIIDGQDIRPLMFAEAGAKSPHDAFFFYENYNLVAVRSGKWKLVMPKGKPSPANSKDELYDLDADVSETKDLAAEQPEIVQRLQKLADKMRDDLGDARTNNPGKNRRQPGKAGG